MQARARMQLANLHQQPRTVPEPPDGPNWAPPADGLPGSHHSSRAPGSEHPCRGECSGTDAGSLSRRLALVPVRCSCTFSHACRSHGTASTRTEKEQQGPVLEGEDQATRATCEVSFALVCTRYHRFGSICLPTFCLELTRQFYRNHIEGPPVPPPLLLSSCQNTAHMLVG